MEESPLLLHYYFLKLLYDCVMWCGVQPGIGRQLEKPRSSPEFLPMKIWPHLVILTEKVREQLIPPPLFHISIWLVLKSFQNT